MTDKELLMLRGEYERMRDALRLIKDAGVTKHTNWHYGGMEECHGCQRKITIADSALAGEDVENE